MNSKSSLVTSNLTNKLRNSNKVTFAIEMTGSMKLIDLQDRARLAFILGKLGLVAKESKKFSIFWVTLVIHFKFLSFMDIKSSLEDVDSG